MIEETDKRYPLTWPVNWKRASYRTHSQFRVSEWRALSDLEHEVELLGGMNLIISTNMRLRRDGLPYASQKRVEDPGVAVYFKMDGKDVTMAADQYVHISDNYRAIGKTIECLRGIKRYGASDLLERAFMGFTQIAYAPEPEWWQVFGYEDRESNLVLGWVRDRYHELAKEHHPDVGGDPEMMKLINAAWEKAKKDIEENVC